jgi:hypothetical protein
MGVGAPLEDRATPGTVIGPVVFLVLAIGATVRGYALERGG